MYLLATRRAPRYAITVALVSGIVIGTATCLQDAPLLQDLGGLVSEVAFLTAALAVGISVQSQRSLLQSLKERAEQAEREQRWGSARAVAAERVRIARELHDVVAHHVSLLVVQASAVRETLPTNHVTHALAQGLGHVPLAPQPTVEQLGELVAGAQAAGLPVTLTVEGAEQAMAPIVSLSAYRIVQEGLTNAIKHAPGAFTTASVEYRGDTVEIAVHNGPSPLASMPARSTGAGHRAGHGLKGMAERAALVRGTLRYGPVEDGWEVRALLPLGGASSNREASPSRPGTSAR